MPLRNTRAIPRGWQPHHATAVLGGMEATVRLSRPAGLGERDAETGKTAELPEVPYYEGPGRVQNRTPVAAAGTETGRHVATGGYLVAVPVDPGGPPLTGDLVDVLDSPDPLQVGLRLYVTDVPTATQVLQRNLGADLHKPADNGRR